MRRQEKTTRLKIAITITLELRTRRAEIIHSNMQQNNMHAMLAERCGCGAHTRHTGHGAFLFVAPCTAYRTPQGKKKEENVNIGTGEAGKLQSGKGKGVSGTTSRVVLRGALWMRGRMRTASLRFRLLFEAL